MSHHRRTLMFLGLILVLFAAAILGTRWIPEHRQPAAPPQASLLPQTDPPRSTIEKDLARGMSLSPDSLCEWEVWGRLDQEVYVWALCEEAPGGTAASMPLALTLDAAGDVAGIRAPGEGLNYAASIRRIFPPEVQERIFAHQFDGAAALQRIASRRNDPSILPAASEEGDALAGSHEALPGIISRYAAGVSEAAGLGRGSLQHAFFSPDGKHLLLFTSQGLSVRDAITLEETYFLEADSPHYAAALSPDGSTLAWGEGRHVRLLDFLTLTPRLEFDTFQGQIASLQYSPEGSQLALQTISPGEEVYSHIVELRQAADGELLSSWDLNGMQMAFAPDGNSLASWGAQTGLSLWSVPDGQLIDEIDGIMPVSALFSPDGAFLAVIGLTGRIQLWELARCTLKQELDAGENPVLSAVFSPDGSLLAGLHQDGQVRVWETGGGELLQQLETGLAAEVSPASFQEVIFTPGGSGLLLTSPVQAAVWQMAEGALTRQLDEWSAPVLDLALSRDGSTLAVLSGWYDQNARLEVYDLPFMALRYRTDDYPALCLDLNPRGSMLALGLWSGDVQVLHAADGSPLESLAQHAKQVQDLVFLDDFVFASSSLEEIAVSIAGDVHQMETQRLSLSGGWVASLAQADFTLASYSLMDGSVRLLSEFPQEPWDVAHTFSAGASSLPGNLVFTPDRTRLVLNQGREVRRWDVNRGISMPSIEFEQAASAIAISADGSILAAGMEDGTIQLVDFERGIPLLVLDGHKGSVTSLGFSKDGRWLVSGSSDGTVRVWGLEHP
jgi:WD40 repeat protein